MKISANINSALNQHQVTVQTNGSAKELQVTPKPSGYGSSVNGAEFLLLALATCFCNDIYREAAKRNITVTDIKVDFNGEFGQDGEPGSNFNYTTQVIADASAEEIDDLIQYTDGIAEIHNTLRKGLAITLIK